MVYLVNYFKLNIFYVKNPKLKEYYMYAVQSLDSLEKLTFTRKHSIIKYHPDLEFNDYNSYKNFMMHIISIK